MLKIKKTKLKMFQNFDKKVTQKWLKRNKINNYQRKVKRKNCWKTIKINKYQGKLKRKHCFFNWKFLKNNNIVNFRKWKYGDEFCSVKNHENGSSSPSGSNA